MSTGIDIVLILMSPTEPRCGEPDLPRHRTHRETTFRANRGVKTEPIYGFLQAPANNTLCRPTPEPHA